jgi:hypothetical protein
MVHYFQFSISIQHFIDRFLNSMLCTGVMTTPNIISKPLASVKYYFCHSLPVVNMYLNIHKKVK